MMNRSIPHRHASLLMLMMPLASFAGSEPSPAASAAEYFQPPSEQQLGNDDLSREIRLGQQIFTHTARYASAYAGNHLNCSNCHLDAGRRPDAAPLWAAFGLYPAYRSKTHRVDTYEQRIQGCFEYSMNGKPPPLDSPEVVALATYSRWLATGAPVGVVLKGQGYRKLPAPARIADYARGEALYQARCSACHGADGAGRRDNGETIFPALWGAESYNWGAGMGNLSNAAGFIQANMPLGNGNSLTVQQAWDLAAFVDGHERPQDPRFTGDVVTTRAQFHNTPDSPYGTTVNGHLLGSESSKPGITADLVR